MTNHEKIVRNEMKIIAIGDIHGRDCWKELVDDVETADRIIFIGDYFDTRDGISQFEQLNNFKEILEFKNKYLDKVILLVGNHDYHYMGFSGMHYSGYDSTLEIDIKESLNGALKNGLIQASHYEETESCPILFSHAGVTATWCADNEINLSDISNSINDLFILRPLKFEFTPGEKYNMYGDEVCQTPIWVRPDSLVRDGIFKDEIIQVVGHTQQNEITVRNRFIFIDCLGFKKDFLTLT